MFIKQNIWHGGNSSVSDRLNHNHLKTCTNADTNTVEGEVHLRRGYKIAVDDATTDINKFIEYRDEVNSKDILLVLDKDSTVGNRKLWHYAKTAKATAQYVRSDGAGPPDHSTGITYGNIELGDSDFGVSFITHRNQVKIGTGTGTANKALSFGYWNRENLFNVAALDFSGYFITKQQWVQQCDLFSQIADIEYDTTNDRFYILTLRGLEIRDGDFHLERVLPDVKGFHGALGIFTGGVTIDGDYLYVAGRDATSVEEDTIIVRYNIAEGFTKGSDTYTKLAGSSDYIYDIVHDGTYLYCTWHDGTNGHIREFDLPETNLASGNDRYSAAKTLMGITEFDTYIYVVDPVNEELTKMLKANPYTATVYTGADTRCNDICISAQDPFGDRYLLWTKYSSTDPGILSIDIADLGVAGAITPTEVSDGSSEPLGNVACINIASNSHVLVASNLYGNLILYNDLSGTISKYYPGKVSMYATGTQADTDVTDDVSYFYGISIVDIWDQEHHLMSGLMTIGDALAPNIQLIIYMNIISEDYEEQSASVSASITALNSRWNDFRRIKKIRVYRAYSENLFDTYPTSYYRLLKEIDYNHIEWQVGIANVQYKFYFVDDTPEDEMPTVTYEESSGLPEIFKPYYTNWKYVIEQNGYYYYGNIRTDELYIQKFIRTPLNSPDICYELDTNFEVFGQGDGDGIKGFGRLYSRFVVFKNEYSALYHDLLKEKQYDVGLYASDSVITYNDQLYFVARDGIYVMVPSGYKKISMAKDSEFDTIVTTTNLESVSVAHFAKKEKIVWLFANATGDCLCYNYIKDTWDQYQISYDSGSPTPNHVFITTGLDGKIYSSATSTNYIYEHNQGYSDGMVYAGTGGRGIELSIQTKEFNLSEGMNVAELKRLYMTYASSVAITVQLYARSRNGVVSKTYDMPLTTARLQTEKLQAQAQWGESAYVYINEVLTTLFKLHMIGIQFDPGGEI